MVPISEKITAMVDILPIPEQELAFELVKRLVLAWDPEYTKVTPDEIESIKQGLAEIERGEVVQLEDLMNELEGNEQE